MSTLLDRIGLALIGKGALLGTAGRIAHWIRALLGRITGRSARGPRMRVHPASFTADAGQVHAHPQRRLQSVPECTRVNRWSMQGSIGWAQGWARVRRPKLAAAAATLAVCAELLLLASAPGTPKAQKKGAEWVAKARFMKLDRDMDGFLDSEEFAEEVADQLALKLWLGAGNNDGRLSLQEYIRLELLDSHGRLGLFLRFIFDDNDHDDSGTLDPTELVKAFYNAMRITVGAQSDQAYIAEDELLDDIYETPAAYNFLTFQIIDADASGAVTFAEFMQFDKLALATTSSVKGATAEFNFKELDLNRDSFVTSAELYFFTQLAVMMANRDSGDDLLS